MILFFRLGVYFSARALLYRAMLMGAAITRLKLHQNKKRETVKRERNAIRELIAAHDYEIARAKAATCIRDELLAETFAILELLVSTAKQRLQLIALHKDKCPQVRCTMMLRLVSMISLLRLN